MANAAALTPGRIVLNGHFNLKDLTLIPVAILHHQRISPGAKLVYSKLLNDAFAGAPVNTKRLATDLGISPRAVRNHVAELRAARLLNVQTRPGKPNVYTVATVI